MLNRPYVNQFSISPYGKTIPYDADTARRANGRINHGYKDLKACPELIDTVPELMADCALMNLVKSLNINNPSFFTTGCFSHYTLCKPSCQTDDVLGYYEGYVEFAFNCHLRVQDAKNYFSLFFHFDRFLEDTRFSNPVKFDWLLGHAHFTQPNVKGFAAAVFLKTVAGPNIADTRTIWSNALDVLGSFLDSVQPQQGTAMYMSSLEINGNIAA